MTGFRVDAWYVAVQRNKNIYLFLAIQNDNLFGDAEWGGMSGLGILDRQPKFVVQNENVD